MVEALGADAVPEIDAEPDKCSPEWDADALEWSDDGTAAEEGREPADTDDDDMAEIVLATPDRESDPEWEGLPEDPRTEDESGNDVLPE